MSELRPPLRARLCWYKVTTEELGLLAAMVEHCSDGSTIWAAIPRLATYSKLSPRTVQRLVKRFRMRGVLTELAPANSGKRRPATYRLNEHALEFDPKMSRYVNRQPELPGIHRAPIPGEPIPDRPLVTGSHQSGDRGTGDLVTDSHQSGDSASPNTKAFDPKAFDPGVYPVVTGVCDFCQGTGVRNFKPPRTGGFYCHCPIGVGRMAQEKYGKAVGESAVLRKIRRLNS